MRHKPTECSPEEGLSDSVHLYSSSEDHLYQADREEGGKFGNLMKY